uniref:Thioredoxinlike protein putative n=1 Tax=Albugo laibachii Nc14 TaxID=890382 RepID=F0VZF4_9STRA|nr:thioredoxinlike protein putative [Albugo laibachii Nc14]|eukprot:CCA14184.1 thioredoxinlike protein putative [Albugo laibachii Nc14]
MVRTSRPSSFRTYTAGFGYMNSILSAAAKNGVAVPCVNMNATQFILSYPRGAYTSARTVQRYKIFDYDHHIRRLAKSTAGMQLERAPLDFESKLEPFLREQVPKTLRAAMQEFQKIFQDSLSPSQEYKLTILICTSATTTPEFPLDVVCHVGLLPSLDKKFVKLRIVGKPRVNGDLKDSQWIRERQAIYEALSDDVEEILLMDPKTLKIYEGSQTNFYAIQDDKIHTADEGILNGTVRSLILEECQKHSIPFVLEAPCLTSIASWDACFISSTSRLVLGVNSIEYPQMMSDTEEVKWLPADFDANFHLLDRIRELVQTQFASKSTPIFASTDFAPL